MSPTYELALQTGKVIEQMGKYYPEVKLVYAIRGNKCKSSLLLLIILRHHRLSCLCGCTRKIALCECLFLLSDLVQRGMKLQEHIVIGTPGTMLDWCSKFKFIDPKKIKVFVLDEADVMIATQGHQDQSIRIQR